MYNNFSLKFYFVNDLFKAMNLHKNSLVVVKYFKFANIYKFLQLTAFLPRGVESYFIFIYIYR